MFFYNTCTSHSSSVYPFISLPRALLTVLTKHSSFPSSSLVLSSALMFFSLSLNRPLLSLPRQYSCLHIALSLPIPCPLCPPNWNYPFHNTQVCRISFQHFPPPSSLVLSSAVLFVLLRSVDCLAVFEKDVIAHMEEHLHHRVYTIDSCHISPHQSGALHLLFILCLLSFPFSSFPNLPTPL